MREHERGREGDMKAFHRQDLNMKYRGKSKQLCENKGIFPLLLTLFATYTLQLQLLLNNNVGSLFAPSSKRMIKQQNTHSYHTATDKS